MQKITPFLWFDDQAEAAANFYTSIFAHSRIVDTMRRTDQSVMAVTFEIEGSQWIAFNGGPHHTFTPAISLFHVCETQAEIDRVWTALLTHGGQALQCGWLTDRFGVSWQVVPRVLGQLLQDPAPDRAHRAMQAMLTMTKLDIAALQRAADGA